MFVTKRRYYIRMQQLHDEMIRDYEINKENIDALRLELNTVKDCLGYILPNYIEFTKLMEKEMWIKSKIDELIEKTRKRTNTPFPYRSNYEIKRCYMNEEERVLLEFYQDSLEENNNKMCEIIKQSKGEQNDSK